MALTVRADEDATLTIGFRSMPFLANVEVAELRSSGQVVTSGMCDNLAGFSVISTKARSEGRCQPVL
jgi:hypothetical protein